MPIIDQVRADLTAAMRAGERDRVGALRLVLSELQKALKEGSNDETAVLRRERKRRLDAASAYSEGSREELAAREREEAALIAGYLPAELTDAELEALVAQAMRDTGASSPADMGRVMKQAMAAAAGRADGARMSAAVRAALSGAQPDHAA